MLTLIIKVGRLDRVGDTVPWVLVLARVRARVSTEQRHAFITLGSDYRCDVNSSLIMMDDNLDL